MVIRMAIADSHEEYVQRLLSVLEEYEDLSLFVYTDKKALETGLISKKFDIVLFNAALCDEQLAISNAGVAIVLLDESADLPEYFREFPKINKYQRISRIYQQILEFYSTVCGNTENLLGQKGVTSIAFYSPIGGTGKTTLALITATKLAMQGHRTFYMNLEDVAAEDCYLTQNGEKGLSELVASLGSNIQFTYKIQSLLQNKSDNLYYMNHLDHLNDLNEMTGEEVFELLTQIGKSGLFDYIVVDMGVSLNEKLMNVFEAVSKIVLVEKPGAVATGKMERFFAQSHIMKEYGRKMVRLLNMDNGRSTGSTSEVPYIGRIGMIQNMDTAQLVTALASGNTSNYVAQLM